MYFEGGDLYRRDFIHLLAFFPVSYAYRLPTFVRTRQARSNPHSGHLWASPDRKYDVGTPGNPYPI